MRKLQSLLAAAVLGLCVAGCSSAASFAPASVSSSARQFTKSEARAKGFTALYSFQGAPDGADAEGGAVVDRAGNIFGTTVQGGAEGDGTVFELKLSASTYKEAVVHSFDSTDGASPYGAPLEDKSGNLFATASAGGANQDGTIVELSPSGSTYQETGLLSFDVTNGAGPVAGFLERGKKLYTTTYDGGANGYGNIVELAASGLAATDVYDFQNAPDGAYPDAGLVADSSGALYGTTYYGGNGSCPQGHLMYHCGTVFKFVPSKKGGAETVLWTFSGGTDGADPYGGVILDKSGNIYGTTAFGGDPSCGGNGFPEGCGTVFKLTPQSSGQYTETFLHKFTGSPDGRYPYGGLVAKGALLYGTTELGGTVNSACEEGCGIIFDVSPSGPGDTVLYSFQGSDGQNPQSGLFAKGSGLYGTTTAGGTSGNGVVFRFVP